MSIEIGLIFFLFGIILILLGIILTPLRGTKKENAKVGGGGVVLIGPIPIAFGTSSKWVVIALVLAIILTILSLFLYLR